jgi:hypothetical protein
MPVNLPCVGTTDDRHQERVGCVGETSETSVDTDRNVDHVSFIKIDRALLVAIQPENLPSTLDRDENLLSRVSVQRRSLASLGTHIGDRKAHCAFLYVRLERGILGDSHTYHDIRGNPQ